MRLIEMLAIVPMVAVALFFVFIFWVGRKDIAEPLAYNLLIWAAILAPLCIFYFLAKAKGEVKKFPKPSEERKFCGNCGAKISFFDDFCTSCGGKVLR